MSVENERVNQTEPGCGKKVRVCVCEGNGFTWGCKRAELERMFRGASRSLRQAAGCWWKLRRQVNASGE